MNDLVQPVVGWNREGRKEIARLLRLGLSASEIAAHFDGKSRNAVIGIVNRDPALKVIGFSHRWGGGGYRPRGEAEISADESRIAGQPMAMLSPRRCRYAVNDAAPGETHLFCGLPSEGSWCPYHRGLVYQRRAA